MSRFFSEKYKTLEAYTPGEQPRDMKYVKLNTNESPFPPSEKAVNAAEEAAKTLQLYPDPEALALRTVLAEVTGVKKEQLIIVNGSDEALYFAFLAYCDHKHPAVFPDITYGFYSVYAEFTGIPYSEIPLDDDFSIIPDDYYSVGKTVFIANPNAQTGKVLSVCAIERIVKSNPDNVVVVDEAYADFSSESCLKLIDKYNNLLVIQTFSKSRSMAGARLGFAAGNIELINDLNTVKYSINPYNINRMTMAAGIGALQDEEYTRKNCREIIENRKYTTEKLRELGFTVVDSGANFVLAGCPFYDGKKLYLDLKARGVLVRHFDTPRLAGYNRITIGSKDQMDILIDTVKKLLEEKK